jgi:hypothetical protein
MKCKMVLLLLLLFFFSPYIYSFQGQGPPPPTIPPPVGLPATINDKILFLVAFAILLCFVIVNKKKA